MKFGRYFINKLIPSIVGKLGVEKGSWSEEKINIVIQSIFLIPYKRLKGIRRHSQSVEAQYDSIAGAYINQNYYEDRMRFSVVDGEIKRISSIENMKLIRNEISQVLTELDFDNVLEVGVGELTTLESVYRQFGPNIDCYGVDLSLNRIYHGLKEFKKRHTKLPNVVKANAIHLPFPDNSFDLVFTRHTIEQMPTIYKEVLNEIIRVSRKQVVLFEPSYELASFPQKLKMHNTDYVKGISKYLKSKKNIELDKKFLMKNSANPLNHTACFKFKTLSKNLKENMGLVSLVCPLTKKTLEKKDSFYYCKDSSRAYPIIHGIPVLDSDYSFYVTEKKSHSLPTKNDIWHKKIKE